MSYLRSSIKTLTNSELIQEKRDLTILHNIRNNCNNNYKICCNRLKNAASYDLYMSAVKADSMVNILNQDIKTSPTESDEFPFTYVNYSTSPREEIVLRNPCCKPIAIDKNYKKNGNIKVNCNECCGDPFYINYCLRDKDDTCRNKVIQKLSTPKIYLNSKLILSNQC